MLYENDLDKCILELKKLIKDRDENIIIDYVKTLEPFMNLIQEQNENSEDIIKKISKIMSYQKNITNDLIIQYGEKGNDFYIILKGTIGIFVPKYTEYYMDEEEFILHLLKLRKYDQNELIIQSLRHNAHIFSIPTERFDDLLYDLENKKIKKGFFIYRKKIINKAREVFKYINSEEYINNKNKVNNILPENYISVLDVDESIKNNTERLKNLIKLKIDFDEKDEDKKLTKIPNYEMVSKFNVGYTFGELALEHMNKKRMATIIALTDCDFAVINKMEYNELIKESVNSSKNKFYNLIYKYKIFDNISYATFDKKYYNHFRYLKLKKNAILFNEGNTCNEVYFILNGEYELFVDKNIEEVNKIILQLKYIIDDLKKIITNETIRIINKNSKNKNLALLKIKNNLNLFFNKFEKEINLEEVVYVINNRDILNKKKYLGKSYDKILSDKRTIKLGIYKSRQIIGLNDIINRYTENNKSFFNCRCCSFTGELYHIQYKNFLSMYDNEENVKLYTSELLFQNIYYLIKRLVSHKKYIYDIAIRKENDYINLLFLQEEDIENRNKKKKKNHKNFKNLKTNKIINNSLIKDINKTDDNNINTKQNDLKTLINEKNSNIKINNLNFKKKLNLNILSQINNLKIDNITYSNSYSEKKNTDYKNADTNNNKNENNNNTSVRSIESYNFSKNINDNISKKIKKSISYNFKKNTTNIIKYKSRNILNENKWISKTKYSQNDTKDFEEKNDYPVIVINNKEIKINENSKENLKNDKKNYKNIFKSFKCENKEMNVLANSKELKNIVLFGDFSYEIQNKFKNKNLFRKQKDIVIRNNSKLNINNIITNNIYEIHNYTDRKKCNSTSSKIDKPRFLTYNLSDISGNKTKEVKLVINESLNSNFLKNGKNCNEDNKKKYKNNYIKSSSEKNICYRNNLNNVKKSSSLLKNSFLKQNLSGIIYKNKIYKDHFFNNKSKYLPLIKSKK